MTNEELRQSLLMEAKNGYTRINDAQRAEMEAYCKDYMAFMDACKTEREATEYTVVGNIGIGRYFQTEIIAIGPNRR